LSPGVVIPFIVVVVIIIIIIIFIFIIIIAILHTDEKILQFRLRAVYAEGPFYLLAHST
jgi:hypothetical protein